MSAAPSAQSTFVGRPAELALVRRAIERAAGGRGSLVLVEGEAGQGKTRLAEEAAVDARRLGVHVLWSTAIPDRGAPVLWPWIEIVRAWLGDHDPAPVIARVGPVHAADVAGLTPELGVPAVAPPGDPDQARFRQFDAVAGFLTAAADRAPMLVVLDDLHEADPHTVGLVDHLSRRLRGAALAIVGLHRPRPVVPGDPLTTLAARTSDDVVHIRLSGLDEAGVAALLAADLGRTAEPATVEEVHRRTAGNPYLVRELARTLRERAIGSPPPALPTGVVALVAQRVSDLSPAAQRLVRCVSVLAGEFDAGLAAEVADLPLAEVSAALAEAGAAGLVAPGPTPTTHRFAHALTREALVDGLDRSLRRAAHRRAGRALARRHEHDPLPVAAAVAGHLAEADPPRAVEHLEVCAAHALSLRAPDEAATHLDAALEIVRRAGLAADIALRLRLARGGALAQAGRTEESRAEYLEAAALARVRPDADALARAALGYGGRTQFAGIAGADATLVAVSEQALDALGPEPSLLRVDVLGRLALELPYVDAARARRLAEEAAALAGRLDGAAARLRAAWLAQYRLHGTPHAARRAELNAEVAQRAAALGEHTLAVDAAVQRVVDLLAAGDIDAFERAAADLERAARHGGRPDLAWWPALWRAMQALVAGRADEADALAGAALAAGAHAGRIAVDHYGMQLLGIRREQGRLAELVDVVAGFATENPHVPAYRAAEARVLASLGRADEARAVVGRLGGDDLRSVPLDYNWPVAAALLAETAALVDAPGLAATVRTRFEAWRGTLVTVGLGALCLGPADLFLALAALTAGDADAAARHLVAAEVSARRLGPGPILDRVSTARERLGAGDRGGAIVAATGPAADLADDARPPSGPELRRDGDHWMVGYAGRTAHVRDVKGMAILARLVDRPGEEHHVLDLGEIQIAGPGTGPRLDERARDAYRRRIEEVQDDLDEAEANHDAGRAGRARAELEALVGELSAAYGRQGRPRPQADPTERARKAVLERIRRALAVIDAAHPALAGHLARSVRTGTWCVYDPEPAPRPPG